MACKMHRRIAMHKKLQVLRALTKSKSVKKRSIIMDAFRYIYKLRLQVEAIQKEYQNLVNNIQEVKVEKVGTGCLVLRIRCKKGDNLLVSILEAFEEMNINVLKARVSSKHVFGMEAIVQTDIDASILNQAIHKIINENDN
ncbi:hypothetical protein CASFOL_014351 [Castilleja foliolosa]|uniref:Plant bHLH transcription factor ACT-like domain-containing protein n=1 Tax=Castilleja foliolosa TaxID=1961234 RepID=A0ABD3DMM9_9LAMI